MAVYFIAYYALITIALLLSFVAWTKGHKRFFYLLILLTLTLLTELLAHLLINEKIEFVWMYHIFCPLEYTLLSLFFIAKIKISKLRTVFVVCIPVFIIFSIFISWLFYNFKTMPGINIGIEGFFLFCICTFRLFNLDINENRTIFKNSDFWICTGLLIFFGVCSIFFGVYTPLFNLSIINAFQLFGLIVEPLNLLLYSFIIIGLLCLKPEKKYITR